MFTYVQQFSLGVSATSTAHLVWVMYMTVFSHRCHTVWRSKCLPFFSQQKWRLSYGWYHRILSMGHLKLMVPFLQIQLNT